MYIALKTHISFGNEVLLMSDLKHDVTAERWAVLIKERMESGMTVREWCHDRDIKESRYYYWLRILRQDAVKEKEHRQQVSPFVELPADIWSLNQPQQLSEKEILLRKYYYRSD